MVAIHNGDIGMATLLRRRGASVEAKDSVRWTSLIIDTVATKLEMVKLLLDREAKMDGKYCVSRTPTGVWGLSSFYCTRLQT